MNKTTPALLARHGIDSSLMDDDASYTLPTDNGDLVEIPGHWTNDDWEQFAFTVDPPTGSDVIETYEKAFQVWREACEGLYHYNRAFILTMYPEIMGRPARLLMLGRLINHKSTTPLQAGGVWKLFCSQTCGLDCNLISSLQAAGNVPLPDSIWRARCYAEARLT